MIIQPTNSKSTHTGYSSFGGSMPHCAAFSDKTRSHPPEVDIDRLQQELKDLNIALQNATEHGDLLEEHLFQLSTTLAAEVRERKAAEEKLKLVLTALRQDKSDLEVLVQILVDQGDTFAQEGETARVDALTGIANRRRFDEHLALEWKRHAQTRQPLAALLCDVDHFKLFNDRYGHQGGDECLKAVASALQRSVRKDDLVARYGGEEFVVILPYTDEGAAADLADRVRRAVSDLEILHEASPVSPHVTLSIGVSCGTPLIHAEAGSLIETADRNLYIAKNQGRNRVVCGQERN